MATVGSSLIDAQKTYEVDAKYLLRGGYLLKQFPLKSLAPMPGLPPMGELTQFKQVRCFLPIGLLIDPPLAFPQYVNRH